MVFSWVRIAIIAGRHRDDKSVIANAPAVRRHDFSGAPRSGDFQSLSLRMGDFKSPFLEAETRLAPESFSAQIGFVKDETLAEKFTELSTPLVTDAAVRLKLLFRIAPAGIAPVISGSRVAGRVLPAKHLGSVDVFLEAMEGAEAGDVLVIDNAGRRDEGCIGDLTALEARSRAGSDRRLGNPSRHAGTAAVRFSDLELRDVPERAATSRSPRQCGVAYRALSAISRFKEPTPFLPMTTVAFLSRPPQWKNCSRLRARFRRANAARPKPSFRARRCARSSAFPSFSRSAKRILPTRFASICARPAERSRNRVYDASRPDLAGPAPS
jgi:hypothetical protein